jgi:adenylate kinase family enzyme
MTKIIIELLLKIHLYYPIGMMQMQTEYPGRISFNKIIEEKINAISNQVKNPWTISLEEIEKSVSEYKVYNYSFDQFPNYLCEIDLGKFETEETNINRKIVINLSLLTKHYTIFFIDSYKCFRYADKTKTDDSSDYFQYRIAYYHSSKEKNELQIIDSLKKIIEKNFSKYEFVEHKILLNYEIDGGCPYDKIAEYRAFPDKKYSIYEYLFSDNIDKRNMFIIE